MAIVIAMLGAAGRSGSCSARSSSDPVASPTRSARRDQHLDGRRQHAPLRGDHHRPDRFRPPLLPPARPCAAVVRAERRTMRDPDFTLSAGPVSATPRVLAALGSPIVYHYDPAFIERFRATERKLADVFLTTNDVLLMWGVLGLEAAARGAVPPRGRRCRPRPGGLRQGDGLLAEGLRRRAPRARGGVQRRGRPGRRRAIPRQAPSISSRSSTRSSSGTVWDVGIAPRRADTDRLRVHPRRHRVPDQRLAARRLRRRCAEVSGRAARHVADHRERRRLGSHPREPCRAARLLPLDARLEGAMDRRGQVPARPPSRSSTHRGVGRRAARRGPRGVDRPPRALLRAGPASAPMGLELWPRATRWRPRA